MIIIRKESGQYQATQTSPATDGVLRYSVEGYGDTHSEAINKCLAKWFGTDERNDEDDDSYLFEADMSNIEPGFNPDF
jgi:hypothetical protein